MTANRQGMEVFTLGPGLSVDNQVLTPPRIQGRLVLAHNLERQSLFVRPGSCRAARTAVHPAGSWFGAEIGPEMSRGGGLSPSAFERRPRQHHACDYLKRADCQTARRSGA